MKDYLNNYPYPVVRKGSAEDIEDFFNQIIKFQFKNKDAIKKQHDAILEYLKLEGHILFLRMYGSFKPEKYESLRRGFLTEFPDRSRMAFCDNTFAMLFSGIKLSGYGLSVQELMELLSKKELVCSFGQTTSEKELAYYTPKNAIRLNLNSKGWYLAHIKPVGTDIEGKKPSEFFANPDRSEWCAIEKMRKVKENLNESQKSILKAHFLRLVHPLNSFLVPKRSQLIYDGCNIGEEPELINFVTEYLKSEFKNEYSQLDEITGKLSENKASENIREINWFGATQKQSLKRKKSDKSNGNQGIISKAKVKKQEPLNPQDLINEEYMISKLDRWLNSIGKRAFVNIYPLVKKYPDIKVEEVLQNFTEYRDSIEQRLSSTKSVIRYGLEREALNIIINSNIPIAYKEKAKKYLEDLDKIE